jgi:hypothetical protein
MKCRIAKNAIKTLKGKSKDEGDEKHTVHESKNSIEAAARMRKKAAYKMTGNEKTGNVFVKTRVYRA